MSNGSLADAYNLSLNTLVGCKDLEGPLHQNRNSLLLRSEVPALLNTISCENIVLNALGKEVSIGNVSEWVARGYIDDSMLQYRVSVDNHPAKLLLDDGAAASFVDRSFLKKLNLFQIVDKNGSDIKINLADGTRAICYGHIYLNLLIDGKFITLFFLVMDLHCVDLLFGKPWYAAFRPQIDWRTNDAKFYFKNSVWVLDKWKTESVSMSLMPEISTERIDCKLLEVKEWFAEFKDHPILYVTWLIPSNNDISVGALGMQKAKGGGIQFETLGVDSIPNFDMIDSNVQNLLNEF